MTYEQFLALEIAKLYSRELDTMPYDLQYIQAPKLYNEFLKSRYNISIIPLYQCLDDYFSSK